MRDKDTPNIQPIILSLGVIRMPKSKVYNLSDEEFKEMIKRNHSWCACAKEVGLSPNGSNSRIQLQKRVTELNLSTAHFDQTQDAHKASTKYTLEEIMVEDSTYQNITKLKERIIDADIIPYKCAICGNTGEWLGKRLGLQLDHINGKHFDHRKENLRFLCPNCHSQTETFSGKNKR